MKIVSLIASSTEICYLLELDDQISGISHECDFPASIKGLPVLTTAKIDATVSSREIDQQVRDLVGQGLSVYNVDEKQLKEVNPDLIITQDQCEVCAVSLEDVKQATCNLLGSDVEILSLSPITLDDIYNDILRVGKSTGREELAQTKVKGLQERLARLIERTKSLSRPKVLAVEWMDPPMIAGHWTPELIRAAGGDPILSHEGSPTGPVDWEKIAAAEPEVILIHPCGFKLDQSKNDMEFFLNQPGMQSIPAYKNRRIYILDGNAYFNRPGPRLVDSAEIAARAIHPELAEHYPIEGWEILHWKY